MVNRFENDKSYISTKWLLRLIRGRGLTVEHLLRVTHKGTGVIHMVALLKDNRYICDCCMGTSLGLPCRHYFQVLSMVKNLEFDIGVIQPR
jgi:predicted methyltransferase